MEWFVNGPQIKDSIGIIKLKSRCGHKAFSCEAGKKENISTIAL
jgi:hypothetical protein